MKKYNDWIISNYPTPESALNNCAQACHKMKIEFPELIITNGTIQVGIEKDERSHWWLKNKNDEIIDPTAHQYNLFDMSIVFYNEIDDDHDLRKYSLAKCINCGDKYFLGKNGWNNSISCSNNCCLALEKEFNNK